MIRILLFLVLILFIDTAHAADVEAVYIEVVKYVCASDQDLSFGNIRLEVWGEGWHYIEYYVRCANI